MLLRESSKLEDRTVDLGGVFDKKTASGVAEAALLISFSDAIVSGEVDKIKAARTEITTTLGAGALVEAASIVAIFSMLDRLANAIGIPLEDFGVSATKEFRERLGINQFRSASNTLGAV